MRLAFSTHLTYDERALSKQSLVSDVKIRKVF